MSGSLRACFRGMRAGALPSTPATSASSCRSRGKHRTPIDTGAAAFRAVARRDLVLWRSYQTTRHVVRGYTSAAGTKNYWTPPDGFSVKSVALGDSALAWVVASGPDVDHSTWPYTSAKLYWAPYTTDPAALAARESVELPKADLIYLKTGGGFAVTRGGILSDVDAEPKGVYPLVVVELASGRSWEDFPAQGQLLDRGNDGDLEGSAVCRSRRQFEK